MAWFCAFLEIPSGSFRPCYHGGIENNKGELYPDQIRTVDDQDNEYWKRTTLR